MTRPIDKAKHVGIPETLEVYAHDSTRIPTVKIVGVLRNPLVEEISMEGPGVPVAIVHRDVSNYTWLDTNIFIPSEEEAAIFVQKLAQKCGKYISTAFPILEARSPEGHRIALALGEVSGRGSSFTIRKFPEKPLTITQLIGYGTLSPLMAAYFWILLENL